MSNVFNKAAIEEIMRLARKNAASAAAADTNNNTDNADDDSISPRVREFMMRLEENEMQLVDADELCDEMVFRLVCSPDSDPDMINMRIIAHILEDDIEFFVISHGRKYSYVDAYMEGMVWNCWRDYLDRAFEVTRDRAQEHKITKTLDDYIH